MNHQVIVNSNDSTGIAKIHQAIDEEEYKICKRRGHEAGSDAWGHEGGTFYRCKWCNTQFHYEPSRLVEEI